MAKRKCTHSFVGHQCDGDRVVSILCAVAGCNARLSLGPSNDADVPADEVIAAVCAHSDADHEAFEATDGWPWDVTRPLAEQWPWNGLTAEEQALRSLDGARAATADMVERFAELTGPTDQGQPRAETREEYNQRTGTTRHTVPGEPFSPEDSATTQPWADPGASTRMTDAELVKTVAYAPPGSVRE